MRLLERFVQETCDAKAGWFEDTRLLNYTGANVVMASGSELASTPRQRNVVCDSKILKG